ncbi:hypothetical protein LCGC14_2759440 [marine sediment metagenome]|uniref:Uncharacterized protein n=1 Tax=marine sediment metagenome TaxID=412755 RepID=A0A0F8YZE6_9ZZZZ
MRLTQKQETFTQNLFKGMYQRDAYIDAYHPKYKLCTIDGNASRLAHNEQVLARWEELRQVAKDASVATVLECKQVLTEIIRARMTNYMTCSADGVWMHDIGLETLHSAALKKIRTTTMPFGDKEAELKVILTEVELLNPMQAIDLLCKINGSYAPEKHAHLILKGELTDDELLAIASGHPSSGGNGASETPPSP